MSLWFWLLLACVLAYAWKLVGYFVPARFLGTRGCPVSPAP
jgi:hypothetical protein